MIFQEESGDIDTELSFLCDAELDDETIGKALSSPLFIQEREEPADRRQAYHSHEESLLSAQSFFAHARTERPVHGQKRKSSREMENERIRILLERQKEQILADVRTEIQKHEFQADSDRRSIQKLNGIIESQRGEINRALAGDEQLRRDQLLLHEQFLKHNWDLREAHEKSLYEMEELKRFQGSTFDTIVRRKLVEDRDTILELTGKIQELQNEINCMNDSRDFQDAESVRSGHSHVASSQAGKNENQTPVQDQRCQSGPSAKSSVIPSEGDYSKNYGAGQQQLQISDLQFDKFTTPATFACWKIRFKTEVCTCSQFPTEAMLWIKEVEMVDSVDDSRSSLSVRGIRMPDFEVLDAKIASALNRIFLNTRFKKKGQS